MFYSLVVFPFILLKYVSSSIPSVRPPTDERTYVSPVIDDLLNDLSPLLLDQDIATLLQNCLPNTLDTTVLSTSPDIPDSFVITGDIEALWLRDSTNQILPYVPYAPKDPNLQILVEGLINRQANSVLIDPFANAFNYNASGAGHQDDIRTPNMTPSVFEGKYEIDSPAAFLKISYWYWKYTESTKFMTTTWANAVQKVLSTIRTMQTDDGNSQNPPYLFQRQTTAATDSLMMYGRGPATKLTGLSRSLFRPSDDATTYQYNIPGNAMMCSELNHLTSMLNKVDANTYQTILKDAQVIIDTLCATLEQVISSTTLKNEKDVHYQVLPYEIDGFGSEFFMDDANVPSLLSLPVLGYMSSNNPVYLSTRKFVLSSNNPYFYSGKQGEGVGGPHVGYNYAWPMAIVQRAMTSSSDDEIKQCLDMLVRSAKSTGFMHETFNVNNVNDFTRRWFAWANGLFGELVLQLIVDKPHLLVAEENIAAAQALVQIPVSLMAQKETIIQ
mmetsp:Transcript_3296/g.3261  ORF Transcript_3296/g.3261 Transcript_3296/m.3261 type:complete len:499 (-) Transcript_3296:352-1848(-)|eukprot:CAMPEP_0174821380 /NCGR_PEP_ID=MMETSP1107-20130205/7276_1 /TAXON_ID=36770 /ORGANISM="Paraphysomonas vestita, Strain GFlagA" /LENGTH=498 /DNA_ID=CAMNT_0016038333 /DNA_START=64 /DNA_END=1560 /DNA_ORIENTATION=-